MGQYRTRLELVYNSSTTHLELARAAGLEYLVTLTLFCHRKMQNPYEEVLKKCGILKKCEMLKKYKSLILDPIYC